MKRLLLLLVALSTITLAASPSFAACSQTGTVFVSDFATTAGAQISGLGRTGCLATVTFIDATLGSSTASGVEAVGVFLGACSSGNALFETQLQAGGTAQGQMGSASHYQMESGHSILVTGGQTFCIGFTNQQAGFTSTVSAKIVYS
jgi:hypothetical protein